MKVGMIDRITIFYVPTALFDRSLIHIYLICLSKHYANPNRSSIIGGYEKSFCLAQMQTLQAKNSESLVMLLHIHRFDSHIKIIPNWLDTSVLFCHKIKQNPRLTKKEHTSRNHLDLYHDESLIQRIMVKNGSVHFKCLGTSPHP